MPMKVGVRGRFCMRIRRLILIRSTRKEDPMTLLKEEKFFVAYLAFLAVLMVVSIFFVEGS